MVDLLTSATDSLIGDLIAPYALILTPSHYMGTVFPDVTLAENHTDTSVITQHPVQGGSPISDHYFDNPPSLEIRAGYSDSTGGYVGYVNDAYDAILAQRATREPFTVSTGLRQYDDMLFAQISATRDVDTDNVLMFSVVLQHVVITSTDSDGNASTQADPSRTASSTDGGNQTLQPTTVATGTESETAASALVPALNAPNSGLSAGTPASSNTG